MCVCGGGRSSPVSKHHSIVSLFPPARRAHFPEANSPRGGGTFGDFERSASLGATHLQKPKTPRGGKNHNNRAVGGDGRRLGSGELTPLAHPQLGAARAHMGHLTGASRRCDASPGRTDRKRKEGREGRGKKGGDKRQGAASRALREPQCGSGHVSYLPRPLANNKYDQVPPSFLHPR